jgi:hypothetical protein
MTVRIAQPDDQEALYQFLLELHKDNPLGFAYSEQKVRAVVEAACCHKAGVAGVIGKDPIEASVGIFFQEFWYSDEPYLAELWLFVRPDRRQLGYADELTAFCQSFRERMVSSIDGRTPLLLTSVTSLTRLRAKMRWWRRWATPVGGIFAIGDLPKSG